MGILLFPLQKSMKEVVLFDRRRRGKKQAGAENASRKWRKKKKTVALRVNKVTIWMFKPK